MVWSVCGRGNPFLDQSIGIDFLDQSIGIDKTNTFQLNFFRGLWALEWAWHTRVINLRCVLGYEI